MLCVQNRAGRGVFEVEVEATLFTVALDVWGQKHDRFAGNRVVKHHRREVGNHHIGRNVKLGDIWIHRDIDGPPGNAALVHRVSVGVPAVNHGEAFWKFDVFIHEVHRLPIAGCAAVVVAPSWRIHDYRFARVGDSNFFTDALPLGRCGFA